VLYSLEAADLRTELLSLFCVRNSQFERGSHAPQQQT
jgi:hypothetical protein